MTAKYFAILTNQGAARLANAAALGTKLNLTQMAVGDANGTLPTPDPVQTKLINQKRIAPLNLLTVDPANTSQIIAEQIIPENEGGFWIREIGLYDDDGILIAVANCPETYKPQLQEGSGRTQTIRMILIVSSTSAITLKIDPAVVLATRQYVDDKIIEVKGYADDLMKKHVEAANPHKQYPLIANALKEMVDAGLAGDVLKNLGLGEAAKRDVGTGENQIPDMVSFSGVRDFYGKQLLPGGLILQWLTIPSSAAVKAVTLDNGNYQLSGYKWPQSFGVLFAVFATKVSGSTNEAYAISVNRHSTDVIVTWNARKADDVHILGIGKL
ncbi:phage tail protein [Escherichia coli]|uniref:phage tail protein n=1 Tax=Escherichia coli TaxID=562 RepID=UPI00202CD3DE|nr:phage tail protein [Escherichia coli]